jgi:hypothetical protein
MIRYLSGLLVCALGLFGGGWLIVVVVLLRGTPTTASLASLGTGAGVALVSAVGLGCWSVAWRQRMRLDGVLAAQSRRVTPGTPAATARRNRRALRRDLRDSARTARRGPRPDEAARPADGSHSSHPFHSPYPDLPSHPEHLTHPDEAVRWRAASAARPASHDRHPVIPGPRAPLVAEASGGGTGGAAEPERPAVVLTELRSLLEPLLTTGPMPVLDGDPDDGAAVDLLGEEEAW